MTAWEFGLIALLVLASSAGVDFAHARYVRSLVAGRRGSAAGWSLGQWAAASVGFVAAVGVSLWLLPFEGIGLAIGTWLGTGNRDSGSRVSET